MTNRPKLSKPLLLLFKLAIYFPLYWVLVRIVSLLPVTSAHYWAFITWLLLVVSNRGKLTRFLQQLIDKSFYRKLFDLKKAAKSFDRDLDSIFDLDLLLQKFTEFLNRNFSFEQYALYLIKKNSFERYQPVEQEDVHHYIAFIVEDFAHSPFDQEIDFYFLEDIRKKYPKFRLLFKKHEQSAQFEYFVPLKGSNGIVGYLLFEKSLCYYIRIPEVREFLLSLFQKTARVLENARTYTEVKRKSLESALFLEIVQNITSTLNLKEVLESIADSLSLLMSHDAVMIALVDKQRKLLQQAVARGYDLSSRGTVSLKIGQGLISWVVQNKKALNAPNVKKTSQYYPARKRTKSQITVPIISRDHAIGAIALESDEAFHFTDEDLASLTFFSGLAAIAIRNARLYGDSIRKKQLESDLLVASKVQQALLPRRVPTISGLKIDVINVPSRIVGGDLYDVFRIGTDRQGIAIGDVSGKGAPGAILMAVAYAGFKSFNSEVDTVATVVARLNKLIVEATTAGYYLTFFFGILDREAHVFTYCNAGHNAPILLHEDLSTELLSEGGTVLGFMANLAFKQSHVAVKQGDYLVFYTDGVNEVQNHTGEEFGEERLIETLKKNYGKTPRQMRIAILDEMKKFAEGCEFQDDVTLLIAKVT